jgi:ribokinase
MFDILIIGSLNADLVVRVPRFPVPGETISGGDLKIIPGGKGANQAVAAAKLGATTAMLGRVGQDQFGKILLNNLERFQVDTSRVQTSPSATGTAVIIVDEIGQNSIVLSPGANGEVTKVDVNEFSVGRIGARFVLLQLEIPLDVVTFAAESARENNVLVILNPAPARALPAELLKSVDYIVPNESELSLLTGLEVFDLDSAEVAARELLQQGTFKVIVTLGDKGALYVSRDGSFHIPAFSVNVLDTTAAGDAFIAGMAVSLAQGKIMRESIRFACACGALAATKFGAQSSLPTIDEVEKFLDQVARKYDPKTHLN